MPPGGRLGKIAGTDMGRHRLIFLRRQRRPQRLVLALPAKKPSVAVLGVWARGLVDQKEPTIADDTADFAHQGQLSRSVEVMERQTDPRDIHGLRPIAQRSASQSSLTRSLSRWIALSAISIFPS
jgi:hypothetical protein